MEQFAYRISRWFIKHDYIEDSDIEPIRFAIEVVLSNGVSFLAILVIGALLHQLSFSILYILVFAGFRTLQNRFHAKSFFGCFLLTVGSFLLAIGIPNFLLTEYFGSFVLYVTFINITLMLYGLKNKLFDYRRFLTSGFIISFTLYSIAILIAEMVAVNPLSVALATLGSIIIVSSLFHLPAMN